MANRNLALKKVYDRNDEAAAIQTENNYLSTFQWLSFLLANSIALPIVIGNVFQLSDLDISSLMQRTFFIVGLSTFIQAKFGHRFPIIDGPAGSWVSMFVIFAGIGLQQGSTMTETLQTLEAGIIISGLLLLILGITKWVRHLLFLFSPIVTGIFLLILALQLCGVFVNGMISVSAGNGQMDAVSFLLSLLVFTIIILLSVKGKGLLKNYAILIGILAGWIIFAIFGKGNDKIANSSELIKLPEIFPWGLPNIDIGVLVTAVLFTFLLISNTVASISATGEAVPINKKPLQERLFPGIWAGGITHILTAAFSAIPVVPIPATAGFVKLTKQFRIMPLLTASGILIFVSLFPNIVGFMAALPLPVASAALLATLIQMLAIAFRSLTNQPLTERNMTIIAISLLFGSGTMFISPEAFMGLPVIIQNVGKNGLLMGTFIAIILDQIWKVRK